MNSPTYLNRCRRSLLAKQREVAAANGRRMFLGTAGGVAEPDFIDQALAESEAVIEVNLSQARNRLRQAIEWALLRVKKGNYGFCVTCGNPISRARLRAVPWTDHCRDCAEQQDTQF